MPTHNQIHLALGEYVTSFSSLLFALESSTTFLLTFGSNVDHMLVRALVADQTASPIASKFFSVLAEKWNSVLSDDDMQFIKALRKSISISIEKRNRYMHDAWLMSSTSDGLKKEEFALSRTRPHGTGVEFTTTTITIDILKNESKELKELGEIVNALAFYSNPNVVGPNISSRFGLDKNNKPVQFK